jgi:hypothetical protein
MSSELELSIFTKCGLETTDPAMGESIVATVFLELAKIDKTMHEELMKPPEPEPVAKPREELDIFALHEILGTMIRALRSDLNQEVTSPISLESLLDQAKIVGFFKWEIDLNAKTIRATKNSLAKQEGDSIFDTLVAIVRHHSRSPESVTWRDHLFFLQESAGPNVKLLNFQIGPS